MAQSELEDRIEKILKDIKRRFPEVIQNSPFTGTVYNPLMGRSSGILLTRPTLKETLTAVLKEAAKNKGDVGEIVQYKPRHQTIYSTVQE